MGWSDHTNMEVAKHNHRTITYAHFLIARVIPFRIKFIFNSSALVQARTVDNLENKGLIKIKFDYAVANSNRPRTRLMKACPVANITIVHNKMFDHLLGSRVVL